jgi:hypothetical protein
MSDHHGNTLNMSERGEDDVVSFENFGNVNQSRNQIKIDETIGTLGAGEMNNDLENISITKSDLKIEQLV